MLEKISRFRHQQYFMPWKPNIIWENDQVLLPFLQIKHSRLCSTAYVAQSRGNYLETDYFPITVWPLICLQFASKYSTSFNVSMNMSHFLKFNVMEHLQDKLPPVITDVKAVINSPSSFFPTMLSFCDRKLCELYILMLQSPDSGDFLQKSITSNKTVKLLCLYIEDNCGGKNVGYSKMSFRIDQDSKMSYKIHQDGFCALHYIKTTRLCFITIGPVEISIVSGLISEKDQP